MQRLLSQLIRFRSDRNHPEEIQKCFNLVVNDLKKADLKVKTYSSNKIPSLVAARKLKKNYQYILCGHLDVVPANYYPNAFKPIIKNSRMYGRGASDMKGVIAAMIQLIKEIKNGNVALMLTCDEESGGINGVNYLLNKKGYSCNCAIIPDGGDNLKLVLTEKGTIHVCFKAKGKAAHGSRPWLGDNAIEKLLQVYQNIKKEIPATTSKNRWLSTVNLGKITGGDAINKVPSFAEMYLDFRYPKKTQGDKILNLIDAVCKKFNGVSYKIQTEGPVSTTTKTNQYVQKIINIAKKQKVNLDYDKGHGASDGRFFSAKGIPVIMFKPIASEPHADNEWIDLKSLKKFSQIIKEFISSC